MDTRNEAVTVYFQASPNEERRPYLYHKRIKKSFLTLVVYEELDDLDEIDKLTSFALSTQTKLTQPKRKALHEKFQSGEAKKIIDEKWLEFLKRYVSDYEKMDELTEPTADDVGIYYDESRKNYYAKKPKVVKYLAEYEAMIVKANLKEIGSRLNLLQTYITQNNFSIFLTREQETKKRKRDDNPNLTRADKEMLKKLKPTF